MPPKKRTIVIQLRKAIADSSQSEYAIEESGLSQIIFNRFVSGKRSISLETAAKLRDFLNLDLTPASESEAGGWVKFEFGTKLLRGRLL